MTSFRILTPAYNCVDKIERSLYSIAGQTYKNWKMTIINDMSTDGTVERINDFIRRNRLEDKIELIISENLTKMYVEYFLS